MDVQFDYDPSYKFEGKNDYVILYNSREGEDTLTRDRIEHAIKSALNAKNYKEVSKERADLIFVFHVNVQDKSDIHTDYQVNTTRENRVH